MIPGRWEKLDSQPPGKQIIVTLKIGDRLECDFQGSGPDDLTVTDQSGTERKVPKSEVQTIISAEKTGDSILNGTLVGAGAGAAISLIPILLAAIQSDGGWDVETTGIFGAAIGVGAGMGAGIDALHRRPEVLYQAPDNPAPSIRSLSNNGTSAAVWVGRKDRLTLNITAAISSASQWFAGMGAIGRRCL